MKRIVPKRLGWVLALLAWSLVPSSAVVIISNFGSNVASTDLLGGWISGYSSATSSVNSTDAAGNGISDFTNISVGSIASLTQLTLTASVATNPGGSFSIILEDTAGKQASATFNWSSFTTSFTAVSAVLSYGTGFNTSAVAGWSLFTGGFGDPLAVTFRQLVATTSSPVAATVTLSNLTQTYNGTARAATVTTTPTGLTTYVTYNGSTTAPTSVGSYTVVAQVNQGNYSGSASGTLTISASAAPTSGDIPTLPEWAVIFLGAAVIGCGASSLRDRRA